MSKIYDGQPDYEQGGDSGQNTASSIQPINNAENLYAANLNRAVENVRVRTEEIRQQLLDLHYYSDYDRGFILKSDALFSFVEPDPVGDPGRYELVMTADDLVILPALTPGYTSGGRDRGAKMFTQQGANWVPYAGTLGADDLSFTATAQFTGMRGYNDANDFNVDLNGFTLGANRLTLTLVADPAINGGVATMTATVTGSPAVDITITYGTLTPTTITDIITFVNADVTSQGGYGLAALVRASTTSPGLAAPPVVTGAVFQGGYDAEGHKITPATLSAFFAAIVGGTKPNRLRDGESLAIAYTYGPVESGVAGANGGRRQSLFDLPSNRLGAKTDNTAPAAGWNLYNTGREPEKIPGSVPVGKRVKNVFVMLDGTIITSTPSRLGESSAMLARLASIVAPTGASLIGYGGSGPWEDTTVVPPGTLEAALDNIVASLASKTALADGAGKLGISAQTGLPSAGNLPLNLGASSIRTAIAALLNSAPTSTNSGGVNSRVSENGHTLKTYAPVTKDLSALATAGGQRFAAQLTNTGVQNLLAPVRGSREEIADVVVQPIAVSGLILLNETIAANPLLPDELFLTEATIPARFASMNALLPSMQTYSETAPGSKALSACIMVSIQGAVGGVDGNGYYFFSKLVQTLAPTYSAQLVKLDGTAPNFTTTDFTAASLSFLNTNIRGSNSSSNFERSYHFAENFPEKVVALAGTLNPWLETYYPDTSAIGADAIKGSYHLATRSVWNPTAPTPRNTDNILGASDKALLSGNETGIPVDASLSHHHGAYYTLNYASNTELPRPFITAGIATSVDLLALSAANGDYIQLPTHNIPAGFRPVGAVMMYSLLILSTAASNPLDSVAINLRASPAVLATGAYNAPPSRFITAAQFLKQNAALGQDNRQFHGDISCACNQAGQIAFKIINTTNVDDVNSYLQVYPQYYILVPTTLVSVTQQGAAANFTALVGTEVTVTGLTGMTLSSVGRFLEISGSTTSFENNGVFLITAYVSPGVVKIRAPYATVPDPGPLTWSERF